MSFLGEFACVSEHKKDAPLPAVAIAKTTKANSQKDAPLPAVAIAKTTKANSRLKYPEIMTSETAAPAICKVALLGCGTVGTALLELLATQSDRIASQWAVQIEVAAILVSDTTLDRPPAVPKNLLTDNPAEVITHPDIDVVVEVMGGTDPTRELAISALRSGKPLVTANKELLARHGAEVLAAASAGGVRLYFEAAVAGGIPLIRPLQVSLAGETIHTIMGIVNGTTNYILTQMAEHGVSYEAALAQAQDLGYAERDPTADVEGHDAAAKAAILASIATGAVVHMDDVYCEGISSLTVTDLESAERLGYAVKLLAIVERNAIEAAGGLVEGKEGVGEGGVEKGGEGGDRGESGVGGGSEIMVRVHPALVPKDHPLATVRDAYNAVFVEGSTVGELMFYGPGAGGGPTATAVLGDLISAATEVAENASSSEAGLAAASDNSAQAELEDEETELQGEAQLPDQAMGYPEVGILPMDELRTCYYLSVEVVDRPGVLAAVSGVFGKHEVSIRLMEQYELPDNPNDAHLVFLTHIALEKNMQAAIRELQTLEVVRQVNTLIRVVGGE